MRPNIVTDIVGVRFEVKRCETFRIYAAMEQAIDDPGEHIPVVLHRQTTTHGWRSCGRMTCPRYVFDPLQL